MAPCSGWIWLGDLALLNSAGDPTVDPYAKVTPFSVLEFGASYGSGGIGALVKGYWRAIQGTLHLVSIPGIRE